MNGNNPTTLQITCPHCVRVNRVIANRLENYPKCGACGTALLTGKSIALTGDNFESFINPPGLPIAVDFWASWCAPCKAMAPAFEQAATRLATQVRFAKVNTEEAPAVAARFGIRAIPTIILFHGGREIKRTSGALDASTLVNWINSPSI